VTGAGSQRQVSIPKPPAFHQSPNCSFKIYGNADQVHHPRSCEETLYDGTRLRRFLDIGLGCEAVPGATTTLKFRRPLEDHKLGDKLFAEFDRVLEAVA